MRGMNGSKFLVKVRNLYPETIQIILTGHQNIETAIKAINGGEIYRFLTKTCNEAELAITIK
jgi:two-component system probable response regulator PhcQ